MSFTDARGVTHEFEPALNGGQPKQIGTQVLVAYQPHDPSGTARRADGVEPKIPVLLMGLGVILLISSVVQAVA